MASQTIEFKIMCKHVITCDDVVRLHVPVHAFYSFFSFVHLSRLLKEGTLTENGVSEGGKITLLPNVESGLMVCINYFIYLEKSIFQVIQFRMLSGSTQLTDQTTGRESEQKYYGIWPSTCQLSCSLDIYLPTHFSLHQTEKLDRSATC